MPQPLRAACGTAAEQGCPFRSPHLDVCRPAGMTPIDKTFSWSGKPNDNPTSIAWDAGTFMHGEAALAAGARGRWLRAAALWTAHASRLLTALTVPRRCPAAARDGPQLQQRAHARLLWHSGPHHCG